MGNVKCNADRIYKVQAETIEERAEIWSECASVKAKQFAIAIAIVSTIIIIKVIYDDLYKIRGRGPPDPNAFPVESLSSALGSGIPLPQLLRGGGIFQGGGSGYSSVSYGKYLLYVEIGAGITAIAYYLTEY